MIKNTHKCYKTHPTASVAWSAQQSETAQKVQTGGIVGGAGVVGGAVGNVLINHVFDNANNVDTNINNKQGI